MHSLSTRILSALAYDRGEEYDPAAPSRRICQAAWATPSTARREPRY
jgi:hypothetical protein